MAAAESAEHWNTAYRSKADSEVSWYEQTPEASLRLIDGVGLPKTASIIDVGGGLSRLADGLVAMGYADVTVLDISAEAIAQVRARPCGADIKLIVADIRTWQPDRVYAVWHDRAALHFLVAEADRMAYRTALLKALPVGGHAIIFTFGKLGPAKCSGLPVRQYDIDDLVALLGHDFDAVESGELDHATPAGVIQRFFFAHLVRRRACDAIAAGSGTVR